MGQRKEMSSGSIGDYYKLEIYIPETHFMDLQQCLYEMDAGHIGRYDHCLSYSKVFSTWRPLEGAVPFKGQEFKTSCEEEYKVEVTVKKEKLQQTLAAIKEIHPYEEPVINVFLLFDTGL